MNTSPRGISPLADVLPTLAELRRYEAAARATFLQSLGLPAALLAGPDLRLYRYAWGNNPKRAAMKGRLCRLVATGARSSALVQFLDNGQREITSRRALRRQGQRGMMNDE